MTITSHIAVAGTEAVSRFPSMKCSLAECETDEGYDRAKLQKALTTISEESSIELIQVGSNDPDAVLVVGATIIEEINAQMERIVGKENTAKLGAYKRKPVASLRKADRKMWQGFVSYVRIRLTPRKSENVVRVRIGYANPKGVAGGAEEFARDIAIMYVQIVWLMAEEYEKNGSKLKIVVEADECCVGLLEAARGDHEHRVSWKKGRDCGRRCDVLCSPADFSCEWYCDGRCTWMEVK